MNIEISAEDTKDLIYGTDFDDYEVVLNEHIGERRWVSEHELVIKVMSTGKFYRVYYERGLTEMQEDCEMFKGQDPVIFKECVPRTVETIVYDTVT